MNYDINNIFAKIIRNEIPSDKIYEDDLLLIIKDKFPDSRYKTHLLCLSKDGYVDFDEFIANYCPIDNFFKKMREVLKNIGIDHYQLLTNNGERAGQEIMHFHIHIKSNDEIRN